MKLKCYDNYKKQHLILEFTGGDEIWEIDYTSSKYCGGRLAVQFTIDDDGEDPNPKRWSDLTNWEIIK